MIYKKRKHLTGCGKVAMVSGASSGIGKALALELLHRGYKVSLSARRDNIITAYLEETLDKEEVEARCLVVKTDVTRRDECENWVKKTKEKFGRIDLLINNAGLSMRALFAECDLEVLHRLMDVNFWGAVYCSYYAVEELAENHGSLVGISSIAGYQALPGRAAYSASKAALQSLMQTLRIEYSKKGLHVMVACPGFTASNVRNAALTKDGSPQGHTPRNEGKMMSAEDVARYVVRGVEKRKRSLILTPLGRITVFVEKWWSWLTERVAYSYMAKEQGSPFK